MRKIHTILFSGLLLTSSGLFAQYPTIGGVYPHLAQFNKEGECGTGAVVAWAGKLWSISYGPHQPYGSTDLLYEIRPDFSRTVRPESVGGTHANRMIHRESNQLFIGYHVIDAKGNIRTIDPMKMPGRLTGMARSVTDPVNKILYATMEEGFYEVDVHSLEIKTLFKDGNQMRKEGANTHESPLLPGVHGKGFYSGQGVYVYSNNGEAGQKAKEDPSIEAGSLCEWDGKQWKVIRRNQFVEVTGPGGIYGNPNPATDPIWTTGWDHRSALVGLRHGGGWKFFRLPKASNSYDGAHGWNTEWPRIRNIATDQQKEYLMTLHGMFWKFPESLTSVNTAGIRPRSSYLKIIGDVERWNNQLVMGCDDATKSEFLSNRPDKAGIPGAGQSQSNLWFTDLSMPDHNAPIDAYGAIWLKDSVKAKTPSEPFLFAGWSNRTAWVKNHTAATITVFIEKDVAGNGKWTPLRQWKLFPGASVNVLFQTTEKAEWIRARTDKSAIVTFSLVYSDSKNKAPQPGELFNGFASVQESRPQGAILYAPGENRTLGIVGDNGRYYEMDSTLQIQPIQKEDTKKWMQQNISVPAPRIVADGQSYLVVDPKGRRWRLPMGSPEYTTLMQEQKMRLVREIVTERDILHLGGTFFELPADNADGYAKIKPISSHQLQIHDMAAYRGLLVMSGADPKKATSGNRTHISKDGQLALWTGVVDELWKLGKLRGKGGPWSNATIKAGEYSDPYLFGGYDQRMLTITNHGESNIILNLQVDPLGTGEWFEAETFSVPKGSSSSMRIAPHIQGKWVRFMSLHDGNVSAILNYN
jgi:hypothetical protein